MARHVFLCPMRWSDMDAYGHVNNVVFVRYLEEARIDLLLTAAGPAGRAMLDNGVVVVRHEIDYLAPLLFRTEPVVVDTWVTHVGRTSYSVSYEVREGGDDTVYARAATVMVCVDLATGQPRPIDAEMRAALGQFVDDGAIADGDARVADLVGDPSGER